MELETSVGFWVEPVMPVNMLWTWVILVLMDVETLVRTEL